MQRAIALDQAGLRYLNGMVDTAARATASARARTSRSTPRPPRPASARPGAGLDWEVTLGGKSIKRDELAAPAKSKVPLVAHARPLDPDRRDRGQRRAGADSTKARARGTLRDIVQMALGSSRAPGNFQFEGVRTTGWIADFLKQLEGEVTFEELKVPKGLNCELRLYQQRGFLAGLPAPVGTRPAWPTTWASARRSRRLALVEHEWSVRGNRKPVLAFICPTSLTGNWSKEAQRFTPGLPVMVHHGINRAKGAAFKAEAEKQAIVISSYSLLHRDVEVLRKIEWAGVILDEAQNIKNPKTKQARSARAIEARYRIALTGTPIENNVGDLWSLMEFLNPGFLGTQADFKRSFLTPIQANHEGVVVDRLKKLTAPFILRRLKNDKSIIKDLPEKMEMKVYCTLTKEQAGLYEALVREVEATLDSTDGIQRRGLVLATLTKLKQICNHPAQFLGEGGPLVNRSGKLMRLTEMLEEIIELGERALVFTQFVEMGKIVQQHLQETFGREVLFLHGGVPKKQRDDMIEKFQEDPEGPGVFVLSLKAGGTGLNLTRANHVFHFDRWWNPAVEDQATDRVYRIGQTKTVQIHKVLCAGTLEDKIDDMIEAKKGLAESIVGADENWITELSTTELKKIFELQKDAIGE
ncbi:MAG: SNF2-related protein [Kiritimatiellia bacterium]